MLEATEKFLQQNEELYERRKKEILESKDEVLVKGTVYYVSCDGDDFNDGKSPQTAWKSIDRVNRSWFYPGDAVLFRRGDLFRGCQVKTMPGVTYGAYGTGEKPRFYGHTENLADTSLWEEYDSEKNIWKYTKKIADPGTLVFEDGRVVSRKLIPSYRNLQFVCRDDESRVFTVENEMTQNLDMFWHFDRILILEESKGERFPVPLVRPITGTSQLGDLYLRCDKGNPGEVFESIEAIARQSAFSVGKSPNVTIDNICIKYHCFGISASFPNVIGLHVSNCEIGWIGGNIMTYDGCDPNYPEGTRGSVTRFGNAIEIYGGCEDYRVSNCYIYQVFDAGATHQVSADQKRVMKGIRYTDNIFEKCVYGIEYFLNQRNGESESYMDDVVMSGNILRLSGYGWGQQRHNTHTPALIKGWSFTNPARNFSIHNNIFDRCAYRMLHLVALKDSSCPEMHDNTYIQHLGGMIGQYGGNEKKEPEILMFDENAENAILNVFGDKGAKVYYIKG